MAPQYYKKFEIKSESWIDLSRIVSASSAHHHHCPTGSACSSYERRGRSKSLQVAADQQQQQHLLIRLRQQSYLNRSSASLSSNWSNSIDLAADVGHYGCEDDGESTTTKTPTTANDLLKREPTRLRMLRDKFQRKGRKMCRDVREASPSARSLSSSIGNRLSDFRHSWKHFLHKYSHKDDDDDDEASIEASTEADRLRMTDEWIARYHHQLMESSNR